MRVRHGCRRLLALIAAYAVALQPLLAAALALPALGSEASAAVICTAAGSAAGQPAEHDRILRRRLRDGELCPSRLSGRTGRDCAYATG